MRSRRATGMALVVALALAVADSTGEPTLIAERNPAAGMNPFILTNLVSSNVVVEIDWVEGFRPSDGAVRAIETALGEHCEPGKTIEIRPDDEIPRPVWAAAAQRPGPEGLVARFLDGDPTDWQRAELLYVLYVPDGGAWYAGKLSGITERVRFARSDRVASVRTIFVFTDEVRRDAKAWITAPKVERATVVHELGHVLGLVSNPDHEQPQHSGHCTVARCVMHRPGLRAALINGLPALFAGRIPSRYGARCRRDITLARRSWAERARSSPGFVRELIAGRRLREAHDEQTWRRAPQP